MVNVKGEQKSVFRGKTGQSSLGEIQVNVQVRLINDKGNKGQ